MPPYLVAAPGVTVEDKPRLAELDDNVLCRKARKSAHLWDGDSYPGLQVSAVGGLKRRRKGIVVLDV